MKAENSTLKNKLIQSYQGIEQNITSQSIKKYSLFDSYKDTARKYKNLLFGTNRSTNGSLELGFYKQVSKKYKFLKNLTVENSVRFTVGLPSDENFNTLFLNILIKKQPNDEFEVYYNNKLVHTAVSLTSLMTWAKTEEKSFNKDNKEKSLLNIKKLKFNEIKSKLFLFRKITLAFKSLSNKLKYYIASYAQYKSDNHTQQLNTIKTISYFADLGYKFHNTETVTLKNGKTKSPGKIKFHKDNIQYINNEIELTNKDQILSICLKVINSPDKLENLIKILKHVKNRDYILNMVASLMDIKKNYPSLLTSMSENSIKKLLNKLIVFEDNLETHKVEQLNSFMKIIQTVELEAKKITNENQKEQLYSKIHDFLTGATPLKQLPNVLQEQFKKELKLETNFLGNNFINKKMANFITDTVLELSSLESSHVKSDKIKFIFKHITNLSKIQDVLAINSSDGHVLNSFLEVVDPHTAYEKKSLDQLKIKVAQEKANSDYKKPDFVLFLHGSETNDSDGDKDTEYNPGLKNNLKPQNFTKIHQLIKNELGETTQTAIIDGPSTLGKNFTSNIAAGLIACLNNISSNLDNIKKNKKIDITILGHSRGGVEALQVTNLLNELIKNNFKLDTNILQYLDAHEISISSSLQEIQNKLALYRIEPSEIKFEISVYAFDPVQGEDSLLTHRKGFELPKIFNSAENVKNKFNIFVAKHEERGYFDLYLPEIINKRKNSNNNEINIIPLESSHTDMVRYPKHAYKKRGGFEAVHNFLIDLFDLSNKYHIKGQEEFEYRYQKPSFLRRMLQKIGYVGKTRTELLKKLPPASSENRV